MKLFTDFSDLGQKARKVARTLRNLEKFRLNINDENDGVMVGASTWIEFVHSIPNLKTLQVYLHDHIWKEFHGHLFKIDSLPHLECLTLSSLKGCLDFKMVMSVSEKISKLELEIKDKECNCLNLEPTDLRGLKMLTFNHQIFDMVQMTDIMTELEARPDFIVKYKCNLGIEMAEKLGKWLTLPNFKWDLIKATLE